MSATMHMHAPRSSSIVLISRTTMNRQMKVFGKPGATQTADPKRSSALARATLTTILLSDRRCSGRPSFCWPTAAFCWQGRWALNYPRMAFPLRTVMPWLLRRAYMDFLLCCFPFAWPPNTLAQRGPSSRRWPSGGAALSRFTCTSIRPGRMRIPLSCARCFYGFGTPRENREALPNGCSWDSSWA